jgi:hypothetical protein
MKNFLSKPGMKVIMDLRRQFAEQLSEIGFLPEGISISAFHKVGIFKEFQQGDD